MNLQVNVSYTLIITSKNNNDVCVTNNDIQSHVETNNYYSDDEDMLIDYESSDNDENFFSEIVNKINKDIDTCSTLVAKNHNLLNLTPNSLNKEESSSLDVPFEANIGHIQLQKAQLFLKTNETCVWKRNKNCDQTQVCKESDKREKKRMNGNKAVNSGKKISNTNLKNGNEKDSDFQN